MVTTITDVLNIWNEMGVFSYVIPFLLIFAIVFAILKKTGILGDENDGILAIISVSIGLLALLNDHVSRFFEIIFPRFGIGLSIFLILIIMIGFFFPKNENIGSMKWIGFSVGIGVVIWALSSWDEWTNYAGFGGWFTENFWALIVLGIVIGVIAIVAKPGKNRIKHPAVRE